MLKVVGLGPGSEEYLTIKAIRELENAEVILTPSRFLNIVYKYAKNAEIFKLDPKKIDEQILELYREYQNCRIVIASSGDPLFSGIGKNVVKLGIPCEIIPGISSIQIACAKVKTSWDNMAFLTLHEEFHRNCYDSFIENVKYLKAKFSILTSPNYNPGKILRNISKHLKDYTYYVCENLTLSNERVIFLEDLSDITNDFHWNSVIVSIPKKLSVVDLLYRPLLC